MRTALLACVVMIALTSVGCATAPETPAERAELLRDARNKLALFERMRPGVYRAYDQSAAGVAVFPHVGEGGYVIGGSYGRGVVLVDGELAGYCDITSGTFGWQIGGQEYSQVIFFADADALREFQRGDLGFDAGASATIASADASTNADYEDGVAVYTFDGDGAMVAATIGAQSFSYQPAEFYD